MVRFAKIEKKTFPLLSPDVFFLCLYRMYQIVTCCNASMVFKANEAASFPECLRIQILKISLSLVVTSPPPLWLCPFTVSILKSPNGASNLGLKGVLQYQYGWISVGDFQSKATDFYPIQ
jgi:hypothetical protein